MIRLLREIGDLITSPLGKPQPELQESLAFLLGHAPPRFLSAAGATALVVGGAALGLIGSLVAVFQGLRA